MIINTNILNQNKYKALREIDKVEDIKQINIKGLRRNNEAFIIKKDDERNEKLAKLSLKELLS